MSQAEELLNSLESASRLANTSDEPHIVIDFDRYITVPDELKRLGVQHDHDIETVTFDCPRYWDDIDMSEMKIYINYRRSDNQIGCFEAQNIAIDPDDPSIMHFDWTISKNATLKAGKLTFLVCIKKTDDDGNEVNHWNSELYNDCSISEGLEFNGEIIEELYPDIVDQYLGKLTAKVEQTDTGALITVGDGNGVTTAEVKNGEKGDKGDPPVRGVDYYTESDRIEIITNVLSMLPVYDGEMTTEDTGDSGSSSGDESGSAIPDSYTVTFMSNGSTYAVYTVTPGQSIPIPTNPTIEGMNFTGWYTSEIGGEKVTVPYTPTESTILYAHFSTQT